MKFQTPEKKLIKKISSLKHKKYRQLYGLFLVEGEKLCEELIMSRYLIHSLFISEGFHVKEPAIIEFTEKKPKNVFTLSEKDLKKISDTRTPQGIAATAFIIDDNPLLNKPFIVLDEISDPGNAGTIIRTADWFGYSQVFMGEGCADIYNPKTIRSTMGSLFNMKIIQKGDIRLFMKQHFADAVLYVSSLDGAIDINEINVPDKLFGIVFGNESRGVSKELIDAADVKFKIKGQGQAESLNVAVAAGISLNYFAKFLD